MKLHLPLSLRAALSACVVFVSPLSSSASSSYELELVTDNNPQAVFYVDIDGSIYNVTFPNPLGDAGGNSTYYYKWDDSSGSLQLVSANDANDADITALVNSADNVRLDTESGWTNGDNITHSFIGCKDVADGVTNGGAIYNRRGVTIGDIIGDFVGNYAFSDGDSYGGAIYNDGTIGDIIGDFVGNYTKTDGGAIYNSGMISTITGDFVGNYTGWNGGAIYNSGMISTITGDFVGNAGWSGGAISNFNTIASIIGDFTANSANTGGAIYNSVTILNVSGNFISNIATYGGAIGNGSGAVINLIDSSFTTNSASTQGGAIWNYAGTVNITASTVDILFTDNTAASGEAIWNRGNSNQSGTVNLYAKEGLSITFNDTIVNSATGIITIGDASNTYTGTIVLNEEVSNEGTITLNSGTLRFGSYTDSSAVTSTGSITGGSLIIEGGTVVSDASNFVDMDTLENNASIQLTGGTLTSAITGSGTIEIADGDRVSSDASNLGNDISNEGELVLTGGTLSVNINDVNTLTGTVTITGIVDVDENSGSISANTLKISDTGELTIVQGGLNITELVNDGVLNITEGSLDADIDITNNSSMLLDVANVTGDNNIANAGDLTLQGEGTLLASITNGGSGSTITVSGDSPIVLGDAASLASNELTIESGSTLSAKTDNLNITNSIRNEGWLNLTGGSLSNVITGAGDVSLNGVAVQAAVSARQIGISGDVSISNLGSLRASGAIVIVNSASLTASADALSATNGIDNGGTLNLTAGTVSTAITGSGSIAIASGDRVTSNADYLGNDISNAGELILTGGTLSVHINDASSLIGTVCIDGEVLVDEYAGSISAKTLNISDAGELTIVQGGLNISELINNGVLNITEGSLGSQILITNNKTMLLNVANVTGDNSIANAGALTLQGDGTLLASVANAGSDSSITVSGGSDIVLGDAASLASDALTIQSGNSLTTNASLLNVSNGISNEGSLNLTGGTLSTAITGSGTIEIADGDSVSSDASNLGNDISNEGELVLTGGTLSVNINDANTLTGTVTITGVVDVDEASGSISAYTLKISDTGELTIVQGGLNITELVNDGVLNITEGSLDADIDITNNNSMLLDVANVTGDNSIANSGDLTLQGDGTLLASITNGCSGSSITVSGDSAIVLGDTATLASDTLTIASGNSLSANADALDVSLSISNEGELILSGGSLDTSINASDADTYTKVGTVTITDNVELADGVYLAADVLNIDSGVSFDIFAENVFVNTVDSDGSLTIDEDLTMAITGDSELAISGDLTISASVEASSMEISGTVIVDETGSLSSSGDMLINEDCSLSISASSLSAAGDITNNGSISLTAGDLKAVNISGGSLNFADAANTSIGDVSLSNTSIDLTSLGTSDSVAISTASSIADSSIFLSYDTQDFLSMMESNQSVTLFSGEAVTLSNVTVTISQSNLADDLSLDFSNLDSTMEIAVLSLSDNTDSSYDNVTASFEGTSFEHLFRNVRVVDGQVIVDVRGDIYDSAMTTSNGMAGAMLLNAVVLNAHPEADSDLDLALDSMDAMSMDGPNSQADSLAAAIAGASVTALGSAQAQEMTRQLKNITQRAMSAKLQLGAKASQGENQGEAAPALRYNAWITGEGGYSKLSNSGTAVGHSLDVWGASLGADMEIAPNTLMGLALGATYGSLSTTGPDRADGDLDTTYLSVYASHQSGDWSHSFAASLGWSDANLSRTITHANGSYTSKGDTDGLALGLSYELARTFALNEEKSLTLSPIFSLSYIHGQMDGYTEKGSDASLIVGEQESNYLKLSAGVAVEGELSANAFGRPVMASARLMLAADLGDRYSEADVTLIQNTGSTQSVQGAKYGAVGLDIGAGLHIPVMNSGGAVFLNANCELRSKMTNLSGTVGYRFTF